MSRIRPSVVALAVLLSAFVFGVGPAVSQPQGKQWTQVGHGILSPGFGDAVGSHHQAGRIVQMAWHGDNKQGGRKILWAGAAFGGLWKSIVDTSGKLVSWIPLTEKFPGSHGMGSFLIARLDSNRILIGTGGFSAGSGDGRIYRSVDQGATWAGIVLPVGKHESAVGRVSRLVDDPSDPNGKTVLAATSRGIYRTTDFGLTWARVFQGVATGETDEVSDLVQDTGTPTTWYAAAVIDHAILRSTQSGHSGTWAKYFGTRKISGSVGRVSLAATADDPNVLYALVVKAADATNHPKGLNALYRTLDHGQNWDVIFNDHDAIDLLDQGIHTCGLAADPTDAGHVFFGLQQPEETWNATAPDPDDVDWSPTDPDTGKSSLDGGHNDYNYILFRAGKKTIVTANDGGYYIYTPATHALDDTGNLKGLSVTWLHDDQGDLAASRDRPELFLAGTQDNGLVRANTTVGVVELVEPGDGGRVSFKPADAAVVAATSTIFESGGHRSFSENFGIDWQNITLGLDAETTSVIQIDPTPGLANPFVFTHSQPPAGTISSIFFKPLDDSTPWQTVSGFSLTGEISQIDHTTESALHQLVVTLTGSRKLFVFSDVRSHIGSLPVFDQTPTLPALSNGKNDAHASADKSELQPQTIYYTSATSRPSRVFRSTDGGQHWTNLTGDLPASASGPDLNKVVGNPKNLLQLFIATSKGVYRTDTAGVHWFLYSEGLRTGEDVQDIVLNSHGLSQPTLYIGTKGRGFWERKVD